jgi:hypothetical protein
MVKYTCVLLLMYINWLNIKYLRWGYTLERFPYTTGTNFPCSDLSYIKNSFSCPKSQISSKKFEAFP